VFFLHKTHPEELLPFLLYQLDLHHKRYRQAQLDLAKRLWGSGYDDDADAVPAGLTAGSLGSSTPFRYFVLGWVCSGSGVLGTGCCV